MNWQPIETVPFERLKQPVKFSIGDYLYLIEEGLDGPIVIWYDQMRRDAKGYVFPVKWLQVPRVETEQD